MSIQYDDLRMEKIREDVRYRNTHHSDEADAFEAIAKQLEPLKEEAFINKQVYPDRGSSGYNFRNIMNEIDDIIDQCRWQVGRCIEEQESNDV